MKRYRVPSRLVLTLASLVILAWCVPQMVSGIAVWPSAEASYRLIAPSPGVKTSDRSGNEVWLYRVTIDGRPAALATLAGSDGWEDLGFALAHRRDDRPARIELRGHRINACFITSPASGRVRLEDDTGLTFDLDLFHRAARMTTSTCVELTRGHVRQDGLRSALAGGGWALPPLAMALALWRPWRSARALQSWTIAHLALLHVLTWLLQGVGYTSDVDGYLKGVGWFLNGEVFAFPPGYSIFLAPWVLLAPQWTGAIATGLQHAGMLLSLVALQHIARPLLGDTLATLALLIVGSLAPALFLPQMLLSENIAVIGMTGGLWFASRPASSRPWVNDVSAGVCGGCAALARVVPLLAIVLPVLLLRFDPLHRRSSILRAARIVSIAAVVMLVAASWNFIGSGSFALSGSTGHHLYNRVVTEQMLIDRGAPATTRFLAIVGDRPLAGVAHWDIRPLLEGSGLDYTEATRLMGDVALEGMRTRPAGFLAYSLALAWREYAAVPSLELAPIETDARADLESLMPAAVRGSPLLWWTAFEEVFRALWPVLLWMPIAGLLMVPWLPEPRMFLALFSVPAIYLVVTGHIEYFLDRYVVAVLPFALMLAPAPLAAIAELWRRRSGGGAR